MTIDEVPKVVADTVQIEQVLLNLCINARDALNGVGTVDVAVRPADRDRPRLRELLANALPATSWSSPYATPDPAYRRMC